MKLRLVALSLLVLLGFSITTPSSATVLEMHMNLNTSFYGPEGLIPALSGDGALTGTITFDTDLAQVSDFYDYGNDNIEVIYTNLVTDYSILLNGLGIDMGSIVSSTYRAYTHGGPTCSYYGMEFVENSFSLNTTKGVFSVHDSESVIVDCSLIADLDGNNIKRLTQDLLPEILFSTSHTGAAEYSTGPYYGWAAGVWYWSTNSVPETTSIALMGFALVGLGTFGRKKIV